MNNIAELLEELEKTDSWALSRNVYIENGAISIRSKNEKGEPIRKEFSRSHGQFHYEGERPWS